MASLPAVSRAAALVAPGHIDIIELPVPEELEPGSLLVRVEVATLCGTDIDVRDGAAGQAAAARLPIVLGHEMTGRIVRFGDEPHTDSIGQPLREGDRIIWTHGMCGRCRACVIDHQPSLCQNRRRYSSEPASEYPYLTGGLSEYCYVYPTSGRVKVPDAVPDDVAATSSCALRTVVQGFERLGGLSGGESVVIQGSGPLGLFALALAVTGAPNVIMIGGPSARLGLATQWGAHHVIDIADVTGAAQRTELVRELTGGRGADVVIEISGQSPRSPKA
jgi:threonine dehydrogenase-like Zn-dependent dehydrogenase